MGKLVNVHSSTIKAMKDAGLCEAIEGKHISFKAAANTYTVSLREDGSLLVDGVIDLLLEPLQSYSVAIRSKEKTQ